MKGEGGKAGKGGKCTYWRHCIIKWGGKGGKGGEGGKGGKGGGGCGHLLEAVILYYWKNGKGGKSGKGAGTYWRL